MSVYNVVRYVRQALDSVLAQTYKDFELLVIDDCSKDDTWQILEEYSAKDNRIRLLKQERNQGLSVSRNRAIAEAKGEYLLMLDGDDLFAPDMVEKALRAAKSTEADMVLWDFCYFYKEEELPARIAVPSSLAAVSASDKVALLQRPGFAWVRLLRTSIIKQLGIAFPPGLTKQDIPVHWKLVTTLDKIEILPERLSYYRQNPYNTTNRKDRSVFSLAYVMDITGKQLKEDSLYDSYRGEYLRSRLNLLQGMYDQVKPELKPEALSLISERLDDDAKAYILSKDNECSPRTTMFLKGYFMGSWWNKTKYDTMIAIRSIYRRLKNEQGNYKLLPHCCHR